MALSSLVGVSGVGAQAGELKPVESIAAVDLARYAGRWHEVAKFPNRFQKDCAREATADYALLPGGDIQVINSCVQADGRQKRAEGKAKLANRNGPTSQLKVRFAPAILSWLSAVWGDYWILDLTEDYSAVLVGSPSREYIWVLSRTPHLDDTTYARLAASGSAQVFDVTRLVKSP